MGKSLHLWIVLLASSAFIAGCGRSAPPPGDGTTADAEEAVAAADDEGEDDTTGDPCTLLAVAEVEAAIGTLAGPPFLEGPRGFDFCVYETRDLRSLKLKVGWSGGAADLRMMGLPAAMAGNAGLRGQLPLPDGVTVAGEWDEAKALNCCEISALLGDQLVTIDFMNTRLTSQQGVALLNRALQRLSEPLKNIRGRAGNDAASQRQASRDGRPKPVPACQLVTLADATKLLGEVEVMPVDNEQQCQYSAKGRAEGIHFSVAWDGGYRAFREDGEMAGKVFKGLLGDMAKNPEDVKSQEYPGPWEQADQIGTDFQAVRKDVRMSVDVRGTSEQNARTVVSQAMQRVQWPP